MGHFREKSAEIFGGHGNGGRQLLQGERAGIILLDEFQNLFQLQNTLVVSDGPW